MQYRDWPVLVTGAGGSIGSALTARLLDLGARVTGLARSEESLIRIPEGAHRVLGSITERATLAHAMTGVDTVFHCAAHKHVGICEANPTEAYYNNVFGMMQTLNSARAAGVQQFVLLSTDKAYKPTSVYGRTKRECEELMFHAEFANPKIVRLCNVLGSSGSVIPLWKKQMMAGGPVLVTSDEATRYFITMPVAVDFLITSLDLHGIGPHIPHGIEPTRIIDLAHATIGSRLIDIEITGLRPGEKLHETLTDEL